MLKFFSVPSVLSVVSYLFVFVALAPAADVPA